jgi:integrase
MELNARQQAQAANLRTHLTEGEISELLELARKTDPRAWAIFALSFNNGLRVTEVLNLRLDGDINWKDRTVRIARLKGSMTTTQALVEMRGKPALSEVSALRAYLKVRIEDGSGKRFGICGSKTCRIAGRKGRCVYASLASIIPFPSRNLRTRHVWAVIHRKVAT